MTAAAAHAAIRVMREKGISDTDILDVVSAMLSVDQGDPVAERRRAFDRDRKARKASSALNSGGIPVEPLSPLSPPSHTQPPLYPPNPDGVAISPAPSERAAALKAIEGPCLEIVAGTDWPVTTAQDWHALTAIVVEHRLDPETELLPSIREQVARKQAKRETVRNWGYFVPGCLSFAAKAREPPKPMPEASPPQTYRNGARNDPRNTQTPMQRALDALKPRGERPVGSGDGRTIDGEYAISAN